MLNELAKILLLLRSNVSRRVMNPENLSYQFLSSSVYLHDYPIVEISILVDKSGVSQNKIKVIPGSDMIPCEIASSKRA